MKKRNLAALWGAALLGASSLCVNAADGPPAGALPVEVDEVSFPDANFRQYVLGELDTDQSGSLTGEEVSIYTSMDLSNKGIKNLKGIEYFTNLETLFCENNELTELDISQNQKLKNLYCQYNELKSLDVSQNKKLTVLNCVDNRLTVLDVSQNQELTDLSCSLNQLTNLDTSKNAELRLLDCTANQLTDLDISRNLLLRGLDCSSNGLSVLDVSVNNALVRLDCSDNQLNSLTLGKKEKLGELLCASNWLESLDVSGAPALLDLYCEVNRLKALDVTRNKELITLSCFKNKLTTLDLGNNTGLNRLYCGTNRLAALKLDQLALLEDYYSEYNVLIMDSSQLEMREYDSSFDSARTSETDGVLFEGSLLTLQDGRDSGSYVYDCGNGKTMRVSVKKVGRAFNIRDVDVKPGNWKYDSVKYVNDRGIMGAVGGSDEFQPDNQLTRSMFATVLYRMAGEPDVSYSSTFTDVADGQWYSKAILWASEEGIVKGYTDGSYGINDNITREQIAKMLYLFGESQSYNVDARAALDSFTDKDQMGAWATDYIRWAVGARMISGKPNGDGSFRLDPKGQATRAECAKMLMMFLERYQ